MVHGWLLVAACPELGQFQEDIKWEAAETRQQRQQQQNLILVRACPGLAGGWQAAGRQSPGCQISNYEVYGRAHCQRLPDINLDIAIEIFPMVLASQHPSVLCSPWLVANHHWPVSLLRVPCLSVVSGHLSHRGSVIKQGKQSAERSYVKELQRGCG